MIKIIFFDFDGTIYSHFTNSIPSSTIKAFKRLKEKGILTFLSTGRAWPELKYFNLEELSFDGYILSNGQLAYNNQNEIIYERSLRGEVKDILINLFEEKRIPIYMATKDNLILNYLSQKVVDVQNNINSPVPEVKKYNNEEIYMASIFLENEEMYKEIEKLNDIAEVTFWHDGAVDVVPKGISKADGIKKIIDIYNININETMSFGDGANDVDMLEYSQIGVAMGNSIDDLKNIADYITDDIDKDGIYNALKYYELI